MFVEPGLEVHHIAAGPVGAIPKEQLHTHVEEFTEGVISHMTGAVPRVRPPGTRRFAAPEAVLAGCSSRSQCISE